MFKSHLDQHLQASVEKSFVRSEMLMRPLMSAAAIGSLPFISDFVAYEAVRIFHFGWISTWTNLGLGLYFLFWMPIFVRCLLLMGHVGSRWWNRSCRKCAVVACQALVMFLTSIVVVVGYSVANAFSPRDVWTSPMHPMPMYFLGIMALCSIVFGLRHLCPCRKSTMIGGTPKLGRKRSEAPYESDAKNDEVAESPVTDSTDFISEDSFFRI